MEALLSVIVTLVIVVISFAFAGFMMLFSFGLTGFLIWYRLKHGGGLVILMPGLALPTPPPPKAKHVKVSQCGACGASRSTPSKTAYMYCDHCGQLMDWDFRAAMSDRRSKAPGPAYQALMSKHAAALQTANAAGDHEAYTSIQRELYTAYAKACPAALSPRIGDERYRTAWVDWTAKTQALQDLDAGCAMTFAAQQSATGALKWDRSNPFQPKAELTSFQALLDAVIAHQAKVASTIEAAGLLEDHPDRLDATVFRSMGLSAFVQGWMQYVSPAEQNRMLEYTGLDGQYIEPQPIDLTKGTCPCCSGALEVVPGAKRVICNACGHGVAVGSGSLPCLGCGAPIEIPTTGDTNCSHCDLHLARIGL